MAGRKRIILLTIILLILTGSLSSGKLTSRYDTSEIKKAQAAMITLLSEFGIKDKRILAAMGKIKRHMFIPEKFRNICDPYGNHPCPIGYGQTISQPYIVAYMTEKLGIKKGERVLEIGTGSGYQAAVISELGADITSLEIIKELAENAKKVLNEQGYGEIEVVNSSGYMGYQKNAPYDAIIVTCAPPEIPSNLIKELKDGGRLILPVGRFYQNLLYIVKVKGKIKVSKEMNVRFVPMVK